MKKVIFPIILSALVVGCNSNEEKTKIDDPKSENVVGVPNTNGNIPDTTNSINLSTHKKDSATTPKDSLH